MKTLTDYYKIFNVNIPIVYSFKELGILTLEDAKSFIEKESEKHDLYGNTPEGFCVYENGIPICKMKNNRYLALHRLGGGDPLCSRNNLIDLFLAGAVDDVYGDLLPEMKAFCDAMGEWSRKSTDEFLTLARSVRERNPETQKDYALLVKDSPYASLFFMHKEKVLNGTFTLEDFTIWVRTRKPSGVIETLKTLWRSSLDSRE